MANDDDDKRERGLPWTGWVGLGALVAVLAALVVWSIPKGDATSEPATTADAAAPSATASAPAPSGDRLERLAEASCELAVLTDVDDDDAEKLANADAIAALLDVRHCGAQCAVAKRAMSEANLELDVMKADDFIVPPREAFDAIAPGLTKDERDRAARAPLAFVVRVKSPPTVEQLTARACLSASAAAAEKLHGFVYDQSVRRIETAAELERHVIKAPAGENVFSPRQIAIQVFRQDDGTARLITLGMERFGSPDFIVRGVSMRAAGPIANVMNAVCARAASGPTKVPMEIGLAEVARIIGAKPADLSKDPAASKPIKLAAVDAERTEGDPDNDIVELVVQGAESWNEAMTELTGRAPDVMVSPDDPELQKIAAAARKDLPTAIKRFEAHEGTLYVKGPFPIPESDEKEWMWVEVASCDRSACVGVLSNDPGYATNLALGKSAKVARTDAADWVLRFPDGGTAGGASIAVLSSRR
ncbi:MAG TPA: DUF2314 domain-containing protein [Labilithrix sp.]